MGRVKIPMQHITDFKKRKVTFERRKNGMFKKALELSTLCDVNVSVIVYTDDQENPEIFPQDSQKLNSLIDLFRKNHNSDCRKNKCCDLSGFFEDRNAKIEKELATAKKENLEGKYPTWYDYLNDFSETDLKEFGLQLDDKIGFVKNRIEYIKNVSIIQKVDPDHSCYSNVVVDDNNYVMDDSMRFYGVEGTMMIQSSNHIFENPNIVNPYNSSADDNSCFSSMMKPMVCNHFGYDGNLELIGNPNFVNPDPKMKMLEDDDIWFEDNELFLQSSPERNQHFVDMWLSS